MSTINEYKSMLRPRDQRQAFRKTKYAEHDALREDRMSTKTEDISVERSLSVDHSTHGSDSSISDLKDYIELQFLQLRTDIQMLKEGKSNKEYKDASSQTDIRAYQSEVLAECETLMTATKQPYALTGGKDGDGVYANIDIDFKSRPHLIRSTSNPLYEIVHRESSDKIPNVDSVSVKKHRRQGAYDNVTLLVPKRIEELQQFRSNSLQIRVKTADVIQRTKSDIPFIQATYDERECLASALQFQIEDLVDGLVFHESELPDCLLMEGCLTEDECSSVRKLRDRKDQIRILLSIIKGRDVRVLKGFMKHIEQHNPGVAEKIAETYERNKRDGLRGNLCARCKLEKQFNIKNVVDSLWSIEAIDDGLYSDIIYSDTHIGAQGTLWKKTFCSLSCLDPVKADRAYSKLLNAISMKNMFTHLVQGIDNMLIKNHGKLTCSCEPRYRLPNTLSSTTTSSESWIPSSSSDSTSNELLSFEGTEYGSLEVGYNDKPDDILSGINGKVECLPPHLTTLTVPESRYNTPHDDTTIPKTTAPDLIPLSCPMKPKSASPEDISHGGFTTLHEETTSKGTFAASTKSSVPKKVTSNGNPTILMNKPSVPKKPNWSGTARN